MAELQDKAQPGSRESGWWQQGKREREKQGGNGGQTEIRMDEEEGRRSTCVGAHATAH